MPHHLMPSTQPSTDLPPPPSQPPRPEASPPVRTLDRRLPCAQRRAVLIRRLHTHRQVRTKEAPLAAS